MHVIETGGRAGHPVVFLHGGGVGGWMWRPTIAVLRERDADVRTIVPDLPGHDRSADEPYLSHEATVGALIAMIEERTTAPATVVGFSLGAQLTVMLAARRPDLVRDAVVISAQAVPAPAAGLTLGLVRAAAPLARRPWFARRQARELFVPAELQADYVRTSATLSRESLVRSVGANLRFTPPSAWGAFPGRATVLVGARERPLMIRSAHRLQAELPSAELEVVAGCGHGIPLQRPAWLAERLYARAAAGGPPADDRRPRDGGGATPP